MSAFGVKRSSAVRQKNPMRDKFKGCIRIKHSYRTQNL
jgi:hypothetical protein